MRREFSAGAVVYYLNEETHSIEYLILHYVSHWGFPKGKLEPGETNEMAALREIAEETGLKVELQAGFDQKLLYRFRSREGELVSKEVTFFVGRSSSKEVHLSPEHTDYKWLRYEEIRPLLTHENAVHLLDIAHAFITRVHEV